MFVNRPLKSYRMVWAILFSLSALSAEAAPKIEHWTLSNGVRVFLVEAHDLPMVAFNLVLDAGSARDPQDRNGLSMLTSRLLPEGTGKLDTGAVAAVFEGLGAEFGAGSDREMASVGLRSLSDRKVLEPAVDLFARLVAAPHYPAASLERERARALLGLRHAEQSPGDVASKTFYTRLYAGHPYAQLPEGNETGLKAITRDDLVNFHKRHYVGKNAVLSIVGDLSVREARQVAERLAGTLPAGKAAAPLERIADAAPRKPAEVNVAHPASQTTVLMGEVGMRRNDPDFYPLYLGNFVLGGSGFSSRLVKAVRDKRGLSYSVYSYFQPMREPGPFVTGFQTKNSQRAEALSVARQVLAEFTEKGPTPEELIAAKKNLTGGFPLRIDSNRKIAEYLTVIAFYGLPLTYIDDFIPHIEAVTAEDIRKAFRRRVHPEHMLTVTVGGVAD